MSMNLEAKATAVYDRLPGRKIAFNISKMNPKTDLLSVMAFNSRGALVHSKAYLEESVDQIVEEIEAALAPWS